MPSGAEILSYKGDASLGLGGDVSALGSGKDNLADFNKTIQSLASQDFVWNQMQYKQKVEDRDASMKLIADSKNKIDFPVSDDDRPKLDAKMKEIDDLWLQNPDLLSNPEAYQKVQKHIGEFNQMTTSAKTRAATLAQMKLEYANNPDAEDRDHLGKYIQEQEKSDINHLIDPYQKQQSFDLKNVILDVPATPTVKRYVGANGIHYMTTTTAPDPDDIFAAYSSAAVEGPSKNIPNQWRSYWEHAQVNPDFMSDKNLLAINQTLERINKEQKWVKGNPHYRDPIAVKNDDGTWKLNVNPYDLAVDTKLVKDYDGNPVTTVDTASQKAAYTLEQTRTQKSIQGLNRQKGKTEVARRAQLYSAAQMNKAHAGLFNALATKAEKDGVLLDDKHKQMISKGSAPVSEATSAFYNAYQNTGGGKNIADAAKLGPELRKDMGVDAGWSYSDMPKDDPSLRKMMATPRYSTDAASGGKLLGVDYPERVMVLRSPDGDFNKTKLVGLNKNPNIKGGWVVSKVVDGNTGYGNIIQADNGFKKTDKTVDLENSSRYAIQLAQGSSAAGVDMNAIINNHGVVGAGDGSDDKEAGDDNEGGQEDGGDGDEGILPISNFTSADVKHVGGKVTRVRVNGKWKKFLGRDPKTKLIKYKK